MGQSASGSWSGIGWQMGLTGSGYMQGYFGHAGAAGSDFQTTTNVCDGNWHHLAIVKKDHKIEGFVDGVSEGSSVEKDPLNVTNQTCPFYIGKEHTSGNAQTMDLDEIRISNIARYTSNLHQVQQFSQVMQIQNF